MSNFVNIHYQDFKLPLKVAANDTPAPKADSAAPAAGRVLASKPLHALLLPAIPEVLQDPEADRAAIDQSTKWAMIDAPGGVRLWQYTVLDSVPSPIVLKTEGPTLPLFISPHISSNEPEILLIGVESGEVSHIPRTTLAFTQEARRQAKIDLHPGEKVRNAVTIEGNVVCVTSLGRLVLLVLRGLAHESQIKVVYMKAHRWSLWSSSTRSVALATHSNSRTLYSLSENGLCTEWTIGDGGMYSRIREINLRERSPYTDKFHEIAVEEKGKLCVLVETDGVYALGYFVLGAEGGCYDYPFYKLDCAAGENLQVSICQGSVYAVFKRSITVFTGMADGVVDGNNRCQNSIHLRAEERNYVLVPTKSEAVLLTSAGAIIIQNSESSSDLHLPQLLEQAVFFYSSRNPLTFAPAVGAAVHTKEGQHQLQIAVVQLAKNIAVGTKLVPALPSIGDHLKLRASRLDTLIGFISRSFSKLNAETRVELENIFEKVVCASHLYQCDSKAVEAALGPQSRKWLLERVLEVESLLQKLSGNGALIIAALYTSDCCLEKYKLISPGVTGFWRANQETVYLLGHSSSTSTDNCQRVELLCCSYTFAAAAHLISEEISLSQQKNLLLQLNKSTKTEQVLKIAQRFGLWDAIVTILCGDWVEGTDPDLQKLRYFIDEYGQDFAHRVFTCLSDQDLSELISDVFAKLYPEYVYHYFDSRPDIQWAYAYELGDTFKARELLYDAARQELEPFRKRMLVSLINLEAITSNNAHAFANSNAELRRLQD